MPVFLLPFLSSRLVSSPGARFYGWHLRPRMEMASCRHRHAPPVLHTVTLAAATGFHHRQGRSDSGYRRETTNERAERDARSGSGRGRAGGHERAEVVGALRHVTQLCQVQVSRPLPSEPVPFFSSECRHASLPSPKQSSRTHPSCECRHCASRPGA